VRQRSRHAIRRQYPHVPVDNECRGERPAVDESLHGRIEPFRDGACTPTRRRSRQLAQVIAGVFVELQGAGKAVKDLVGGLMVSSLLESQVVLGTHAGKHGDFLATQSLDASALAVRQADVGRLEQFAAGPQKSRQPAGCFHRSRVVRRVSGRVALGLPATPWSGYRVCAGGSWSHQ